MVKNKESVKHELKKAAGELIEETVFWHTCGIISSRTVSGRPMTGTGAGIQWQGRFFIATAHHVVEGLSDSDLEFVFRPPGTIERTDWWQSNTPGSVRLIALAQRIPVVARYSNLRYDLALLEVGPATAQRHLRFFKLKEDSKVVRPLKNTLCAIGVPFDSYERVAAGGVTFRPYALWGNAVPIGQKFKRRVHPRNSLLMEFSPAKQGREPHGFSGAGAWYHDPTLELPPVWVPTLILAGIITHYIRSSAVLQICRVERIVDFLRTIAKPI